MWVILSVSSVFLETRWPCASVQYRSSFCIAIYHCVYSHTQQYILIQKPLPDGVRSVVCTVLSRSIYHILVPFYSKTMESWKNFPLLLNFMSSFEPNHWCLVFVYFFLFVKSQFKSFLFLFCEYLYDPLCAKDTVSPLSSGCPNTTLCVRTHYCQSLNICDFLRRLLLDIYRLINFFLLSTRPPASMTHKCCCFN